MLYIYIQVCIVFSSFFQEKTDHIILHPHPQSTRTDLHIQEQYVYYFFLKVRFKISCIIITTLQAFLSVLKIECGANGKRCEKNRRQTNKNVINFYNNKKINIINEKETVEENCAVWYKLFLFCLLCSLSFYIFRIILLLINL